jgi:hypothetical protein
LGQRAGVGFLLEFLVDGASFVVSRMVATTENTPDIIRAFRSVTVLCGVFICTFDASWFEMAVVFCVSVSLAVSALSNIPFVLGWFKFDFALLEVFDKEYVLVVRGRFQLHKKHGKRELGVTLFDLPWRHLLNYCCLARSACNNIHFLAGYLDTEQCECILRTAS